MTNNIFTKFSVAVASAALFTIVSKVPASAASFNFNFPLIDDAQDILGSGSVSFEADPDQLNALEKFALTQFDVELTLNTLDTFSFSHTNADKASAVFANGEFLGIEYNGKSQESSDYVLLIDSGDEAIKPGEPGAWSIWGPNLQTGAVDTRVTGGDNVSYQSVPEPASLAGLGILGLSLLVSKKKNQFQ